MNAESFYLAADERTNQQLLDEKDSRNRSKVQKNVKANLGKLSIKHFCE